MPPRRTLRRALAAAIALSVTTFGLVVSTPAMAAECESTIDAFTATPADSITVATGGSATTVVDVAVTDCVETHPAVTVEAVDVATGIGTPMTTAPTATPGAYQGAITWSDAQAGAYKLALNVLGHHSDGSPSLLTTSLDYTVTVDPPEPEVTPPSAPRNLAVSNTTRTSGVVSWQEPAENGGAEITGYRIIKPGTDVTVAADVRSYTVTGLTAGTAYTIAVQAGNAEGYGPAAPITLETEPVATPSAPRSLKVSNTTRTSGKVSWTAPSSTGGAEITGYRIIKPGADVTVAANARAYTVTGLEPGKTYTIKVQAENVGGYGPAAPVTLKTKSAPPSAPGSLKVSSLTRTSGKVSWTAPSNGGASITGYQIIKPGTDVTVKATVRSYTVTKLKPGTGYTIKVRAKNAVGYGTAAAVTFKTKPLTKPSAPRSLKVSKVTSTSGKVSWTAPAGNGGTKITGYRIVKPGKDVTVKAKARSYTVTKLKASTAYTIKVQAKNAKGYGPAASIKFKTKAQAIKLKTYKNCTALRVDYPHGVGKQGAKDKTSGGSDPVTTFYVSTKLYNMNTEHDADHDGVACEKK